MPRCHACKLGRLYGGIWKEGEYYCDEKCYAKFKAQEYVNNLPEEDVVACAKKINTSPCPLCNRLVPVDAVVVTYVISYVLGYYSKDKHYICCRRCAVKRILGFGFVSIIFGWWSLWGFFINALAVLNHFLSLLVFWPKHNAPSLELLLEVRRLMFLAITEEYEKQIEIGGDSSKIYLDKEYLFSRIARNLTH